MDMKLQFTTEQINESIAKRDERRIMFVNQIILVSSTLFGLLVALHDKDQKHSQIAFAMSLVLLSLGILLLYIGLYGYVKLQAQIVTAIATQAKRQLDNLAPETVVVSHGKLYSICEKTAYVLLIVASFVLVWYAIS